ncbi:MAG: ATP-dependent Clp protease ATP-binding subunit [Anaerolineae bacterium]|nr:ATP-dependent Clp protease ATP-binding subunit [Thermoflexales bacterium]MDW8395477.1 ATP-dependent Clp protease ATP-binding subunit [Anaerolineae bacterium]
MSTLNKDLLDATARTALNRASELMRQLGKPLVTPELLLVALLRMPESVANRALAHLAKARGFALADLEREAESQARQRDGRSANFTYVTDQNVVAPLSDETLVVLDEARSIALAHGEMYIATENLLAALAQPGVSTAGMLQRRGVTPAAVAGLMREGVVSRRTTMTDWVDEARQGRLAPLFFRERLLQQALSVLSMTRDRSLLLLGAVGSGRRSLALSLALLIAEGRGPAQVSSMIEVSNSAWLDNPALAMQLALRRAEGGALLIADVARFFGRPETNAQAQAMRELHKAIVEDRCVLIGTATEAEFNERIRPNTALSAHLHTLFVPPATDEECFEMLRLQRSMFERDYSLEVSEAALKAATALAARYVGEQPLPGSAVRLLHQACGLARGSAQRLEAQHVARALSLHTGIPLAQLEGDERARYAQIDAALRRRVIGQEEAIAAVSNAIKRARVGLKDPRRPIGSFLFLGPSGVGKTELARSLAEFLFGDEDALIALDMTEYQREESLSRLIGAPPGYVGYESGGQLTSRVLKSPYAVVLFDEVEKAHPRILDVLLQIMEEGRLTDGQGRVARFSETVVILTSNLGARYLNDPDLDNAMRALALEEVRAFFRPEFLNRLDEIVVFRPLSTEALRQVLDLMIEREIRLAQAQGIALEVTPAARAWLLEQNTDRHLGARLLRRILQRTVRDQLASYLLSLTTPPARVVVDAHPQQGLVYRLGQPQALPQG